MLVKHLRVSKTMADKEADKYLEEKMQRHLIVELFLVITTLVVIFFLINELLDWRDVIRLVAKRATAWCTLDYGYSEFNGPTTWKRTYCHRGVSWECQSPINIDTRSSIVIDGCRPLMWNDYQEFPNYMSITNRQHTVVLTGNWTKNEIPTLCGGPLEGGVYKFQKACFRWGPDNITGSEHAIDLEQYALEVQLYHENFCQIFRRSPQDKAFAIVSLLFQVSAEDNPYLDRVVDNLHKIEKHGTTASIPQFPLVWLRGPNRPAYYSYSGSFTHPPCTECVTWIVFSEPLNISCEQLQKFRKLTDPHGQPILNNTRPLQCVNSREIFCYDA